MHKIAVLADIHGNLPALEAVLADIDAQRPDEVLVGGDLVGRGPQGSAVVRCIRERGWRAVRGNHEDYLLGFRRGEVPRDWLEAAEWSAARWMAAELDETSTTYLAGLPFSLTARHVPGLRLVHGSPRSHSEGLGPWTSDEDLAEHLGRVREDLLVCGHTHRPMCRRLDAGLVVNVGAVGLPFNRDRRAQYVILRRDGHRWDVEFRQLSYDVSRTLEIYRSSGFLSAGGPTARLLELELEHAVPFLVPFLLWTKAQGRRADTEQIAGFLAFYDPDQPLRTFAARLRRLSAGRGDA